MKGKCHENPMLSGSTRSKTTIKKLLEFKAGGSRVLGKGRRQKDVGGGRQPTSHHETSRAPIARGPHSTGGSLIITSGWARRCLKSTP
eukprot:757991-Hanusia_phi.AAC.16